MPVRKKFGEGQTDEKPPSTLILGIGGAGRNIIEEMGEMPSSNIHICEVGTSSRPPKRDFLSISKEDLKRAYSSEIDVKERPFTESEEKLKRKIEGFELIYLIAGLGGRTGSWTVPVCAKLSKKQSSLTIGMFAKPFESESENRKKLSEEAQRKAHRYLDLSAVFPNGKLLEINPHLPIGKAFSVMNKIIRVPIVDLNSVITKSDLPYIRKFSKNIVEFKIGAGYGKGRKKGVKAAKEALRSPWLEDLNDADRILTVITTNYEKKLMDVQDALEKVQDYWPDADIIWGTRKDSRIEKRIRVTVLAGSKDKKK